MPTHDELLRFMREFTKLSDAEQDQFIDAMKVMVTDLRAGRVFRSGLRVKGVQGYPGVFEMTWADDGRATFMYGAEQRPGEAHIIWRRIGGHDILKNP
jgi:hypothetical protein